MIIRHNVLYNVNVVLFVMDEKQKNKTKPKKRLDERCYVLYNIISETV